MEAWDAIRARRNVRSYLPDPIPDADLDRIAEAGWRAPSARNQQHWEFVIVTDHARLQDLSTVWRGAGHIAAAPAAILGVPAGDVVSFLLGIGYRADRPLKPIAKRDRRPFTDVVHHGRW